MSIITPFELDALTRIDLNVYIERTFGILHPTTPYLGNFHIDLLAAKLEAVRRGENKRLIINVPPRSLKSHIASIAFPTWLLGHDPTMKVIAASYGQDLADDFARASRTVMQNPMYKRLFPRTRLDPSRQAIYGFETTAGGYRIATSVGGSLTGFGADVMIIDDPMKPDQASSDSERHRVNQWYRNTVVSRLNDKRDGAIVILMQRLHEEDFVGYVRGLDDWELVSFPAIAQENERHVVPTPYGTYVHLRQQGEALHPEREPLSVLEQIRRNLGSEYFAAQYLQSPTPPGGGLVKVKWFRRYRPGDLPAKFDQLIQSWDTANKASQLNDPSVCTTWGIKGKNIFLLDVLRARMEYPELKATIFAHARRHKADLVLVEDKSSGTPIVQDLKRDGMRQIRGIIPEGDKIMRMSVQTATIENGFVHIPEDAPWLEDYLHELMMFPKGRHDDQVDSTAQALQWLNNPQNDYAGLIEHYRRLALGARNEDPSQDRIVAIRGPHGMSIYTKTGPIQHAGPDGLFRLAWKDAHPFLRSPGWTLVEDNDKSPET